MRHARTHTHTHIHMHIYILFGTNHVHNIYIYIYILLRSNSSRQLKGSISLGGQEKSKGRKTRKSRSEKKVVSFSSASLFSARKRGAVTRAGIRVIYHQKWRKTQGAGIVKDWKDKRDRGCILHTFT